MTAHTLHILTQDPMDEISAIAWLEHGAERYMRLAGVVMQWGANEPDDINGPCHAVGFWLLQDVAVINAAAAALCRKRETSASFELGDEDEAARAGFVICEAMLHAAWNEELPGDDCEPICTELVQRSRRFFVKGQPAARQIEIWDRPGSGRSPLEARASTTQEQGPRLVV